MVIERALCPVLIGRELELRALDDALHAARRGEGQAILVAGDAGIGKSRLAHELERRAQDDRIRSLWGGCTPAETAIPYLPFIEAIGSYVTSADLDWLRDRLGASRPVIGRLFPQIDSGDQENSAGTPAERKLRLFEAILALLQLAAGTHGLLLVLEDLHWADASTCELLGYLARRLRGTRIMATVTYRGEEIVRTHPLSALVREWRNLYAPAIIDLGPLSSAAVGDMVRAIFPGQSLPEALRNLLNARSGGNPFVLEELLRHSMDRGFVGVTGDHQDWRVITNFTLPPTVRDTLVARLDRLPKAHVEIAKIASVLGPSFDYWTLVAASGRSPETVERSVQSCVDHQLMQEDRAAPVRYRFRHALTHEAIYDSISPLVRQRLHLQCARALKASPYTRSTDLAHHLLAAGEWQEAIPICLAAAEEAEQHLGYREAIGLYTRALAHISGRLARGEVLCKLGRAYAYADDPGRAWPYLKEGIPELEAADRARDAAGYRFWLGRCYWERYRPDLARIEYERVRAILEPSGPSEGLANAVALLAALEYFQLRFSSALELAKQAIDIAEEAGAAVPYVWGTFYIGTSEAGLGHHHEGLINLARCYEDAVVKGFSWLAVNASFHASIVLSQTQRAREAMEWIDRLQHLPDTAYRNRLGAYAEAVRWLELGQVTKSLSSIDTCLELAREADATIWVIRSRIWKAIGLASKGSFDEALSTLPLESDLREGYERAQTAEARMSILLGRNDVEGAASEAHRVLEDEAWQPSHMTMRLFDLAVEALARAGDLRGARELAARAHSGVTDPNHPYLNRMEGHVAFADGDLVRAGQFLALSAEAMKAAGHRLDESRTRRALARVFASRGDRAAASVELRQVIAYAAESGATFEGDAANSLLGELGLAGQERRPPMGTQLPDRILATLLFLDIVGSTKRASELGDHAWRVVLERFRAQVRAELSQSWGREVVTTGDGFLARFDGPAPAIRCSQAVLRAARSIGVDLRAGLHTGECELVGEDLTGIAVHVAARVMAEASPGEVLVSRTVKDLVGGAGFSFSERGTHVLKGVPGEWQLYAVATGDRASDLVHKEVGAPLTPREREVAVLVAQGLTNKQIARRLQIAERTAENHLEHILNRLEFQSRAQVAAWAAQEHLI